jgi:hypothetical protein
VFLKNKTATLKRLGYYNDYSDDLPINLASQEKERRVYLQSHKSLFTLRYATYESEDNYQLNVKNKIEKGHGYELSIQEDHRYTLYYKKVLLLQGTWSRNGNELALYDESLQHTFYALIGDEKLISKYLPGEYDAIELKVQ